MEVAQPDATLADLETVTHGSAHDLRESANSEAQTSRSFQGSREDLHAFLIEFVVEQTGYPADVVELDADLEADLGIDSIKKAQLFGELREDFVFTPREDLSLDDFPTLRHVADFLLQHAVPVAKDVDGERSSAATHLFATSTARPSMADENPPAEFHKVSAANDEPALMAVDGFPLDASQIALWHQQHLNPVLAQLGNGGRWVKTFVRGEGSILTDEQGQTYLDFVAGCGSLNLGHNPPEVIAAIEAALDQRMPGFAQSAINPLAARLAHRLAEIAPGGLDMSFFCNSGAESIEAAAKLARKATGRSGLLHCDGSYHGKTMGALSLTGHRPFQQPFEPLLPGCESVPFGDAAALESVLSSKRFAAFFVEPIQGERGTIISPPTYLARAAEICRRTGTLLVCDEVQTGLGRTGTVFACERFHVVPDVMTLAKSLGGGVVPIGAMLTRGDVWRAAYGTLDAFALHTSTFAGGSLACAAALAAIDRLCDGELLARVNQLGQRLANGLTQLKHRHAKLIADVRCVGLLAGIELRPPGEEVRALASLWSELGDDTLGLRGQEQPILAAMPAMVLMQRLLEEHRIYTLCARSNPLVLRVQPPLTITAEQIDQFLRAVDAVCQELADPLAIMRPLLSLVQSRGSSFSGSTKSPVPETRNLHRHQPLDVEYSRSVAKTSGDEQEQRFTGPFSNPNETTHHRETADAEQTANLIQPAVGRDAEELQEFLIRFVVEQTGYPADVVDLDADLEADLGIDSIKKAQMFGELREHVEFTPSEELTLDDFPTLRHVLDFLRADQRTVPSAQIDRAASRAAGRGPFDGNGHLEADLDLLRRLIADNHLANLGGRRLTEQTRLVEDLGLDSLSMQQLLLALEREWGVTIAAEEVEYTSLNVAGLLMQLVGRQKHGTAE
jgi:putrescine aminotransferase